ncbi:hypothetical protein [uncultured Bartonella sp.]|uniref:hypothetical protein n=1 Tax=uncultured Bartonella sp. TaxID=104108 RepID=UPI00261DC30D|nr:hypothetical protein [uncultured Bartonella sp.]
MKKNRSKTGLAVFIAIGECALSKDNELGRLGQSHPIGAITTNWQATPVKVDNSHKIQVVKLANQYLYCLVLKNFSRDRAGKPPATGEHGLQWPWKNRKNHFSEERLSIMLPDARFQKSNKKAGCNRLFNSG